MALIFHLGRVGGQPGIGQRPNQQPVDRRRRVLRDLDIESTGKVQPRLRKGQIRSLAGLIETRGF